MFNEAATESVDSEPPHSFSTSCYRFLYFAPERPQITKGLLREIIGGFISRHYYDVVLPRVTTASPFKRSCLQLL